MARHHRTVQILLLEDSEQLGEVGKIVRVKPGYARNFLFPAGVACPVTADALRSVEQAKRRATELRAKRATMVAEQAEALEGLSLTLEERASDEGHLFGSVGASRVVEALKEQGIEMEEKRIRLEHPLKELGIFNVPIQLDPETVAEVRVWIVEPTS
ncbi:MAG: 50S ribosomal protein L9 [Planctomycetota bacterium]